MSISIVFAMTAVWVLSLSLPGARRAQIAGVKDQSSAEAWSSMQTKLQDCQPPKQRFQAEYVIHDWRLMTYPNYVIQTKYKTRHGMLRLEREQISYIVVRHLRTVVAKFDAGVYSPLGNLSRAGWLSVLNNGTDQLVVSQEASRTGRQWIADFSEKFRIIFNGERFGVGREAGDMTFSDLDGDGIFEITVPLTAFYGFEHSRLTTVETPLPDIIFKYDSKRREYLPANPYFKGCLLKNIEAAEKNLRRLSDQPALGRLMSIVLDYVFVGEEQRGWKFFEENCNFGERARIKADMRKKLRGQPVYRYLQHAAFLESRVVERRDLPFRRRSCCA